MIEVESLTKRYGPVTALADVSFQVPRGQVCGFLGPNGAGKSTTLKILTCFIPATSGQARIAGYSVARDPLQVRRRIGYLPEHAPLYHDMVVRDYLEHVASIRQLGSRRERLRAAACAAERCELLDVVGRRIGQLSKGFRQRVGLAQALIHDPEVLILDEPTSGLDPIQNRRVREVIRNLAAERTVIFSTHVIPEVEAVCDRALVVDRGKLVADDTVEALRRRGEGLALRLELAPRGVEPAELVRRVAAALGDEGTCRTAGESPGRLSLSLSAAPGAPPQLLDRAMRAAQEGAQLLDVQRAHLSLEEAFFRLTEPERSDV